MRLSALTLIVPSYDEGISFYCGTMGFELTQDEDQGHKRWVRVTPSGGGTGFILAEPGDDWEPRCGPRLVVSRDRRFCPRPCPAFGWGRDIRRSPPP